jgi:uncharacterized protein YdeI (YjbR/CyaY-like superfamily)
MKPAFFESAAEFRAWLAKHHASETQLLVGFHKKATGRGITYQEALDEALAHGWIDGVRKRLDDSSYTIRFTPRKPGSIWSVVNTRRLQELIAQKRMKPPGLRVFEQRDQAKTRQYSYERENAKLDTALEAALRANAKAAAFFDAQPPGYRKITTFWVMSAKQEATRSRRLAQLIERSAQGARIDLLKPPK